MGPVPFFDISRFLEIPKDQPDKSETQTKVICGPKRLFCRKFVLAYSAERAYEILRNIFPGSAGSNSAFRVANFRVIFPSAYITYVLFHIY